MTFNEIRERLANRDVIRERQEAEERAEAEREALEERAKRAREKLEQKKRAAAASAMAASATTATTVEATDVKARASVTTTAAADTSSEVAKKAKERFLKETSKVVVKVLQPYRKEDAAVAKIKTNDDFKHLARKVANCFPSTTES